MLSPAARIPNFAHQRLVEGALLAPKASLWPNFCLADVSSQNTTLTEQLLRHLTAFHGISAHCTSSAFVSTLPTRWSSTAATQASP